MNNIICTQFCTNQQSVFMNRSVRSGCFHPTANVSSSVLSLRITFRLHFVEVQLCQWMLGRIILHPYWMQGEESAWGTRRVIRHETTSPGGEAIILHSKE